MTTEDRPKLSLTAVPKLRGRVVYRELGAFGKGPSLAGIEVRPVVGVLYEYPALVRVAIGPVLETCSHGHTLKQ